MCGIFGVLTRAAERPVPSDSEVLDALDAAVRRAGALLDGPGGDAVSAALEPSELRSVVDEVRVADRLLRGVPGVVAVARHRELPVAAQERLAVLDRLAAAVEHHVERLDDVDRIERTNTQLIALRDAVWAVRNDRLGTAAAVIDLAGPGATTGHLAGYLAVRRALAALDRLEVRGRDSAGVHLFVWDHALGDVDDDLVRALGRRGADARYPARSVRRVGGTLSFVYKAAAEIGELGDNTAELRAQIVDDELLRRALAADEVQVAVVAHTRWASVGIISEPNAHPVNSEAETVGADEDGSPYVVAALNGDVDNHADLRVQYGIRTAAPITTDAKVIPALVAHHATSGADVVEAFRRTVAAFEGSVAIAAAAADRPGELMLALKGSGQGLYVGLGDDCTVVASEPYGVVEETDRHLRLDGESGGQIVVADAAAAGRIESLRRLAYDGTELPIVDADLSAAEVTTRDIDRGAAPHFLLKELTESPRSFHKTLLGKIVDDDGRLRAALGPTTLPDEVRARLERGEIRRIRVIGQGTAAVAGQSAATLLDELCDGELDVDPITATELSGFHLRLDMSDTLAIAVSQSGTTTDTNTTVDLLRARGAAVVAIVNRRGSDLVGKADGVLYTSDGRDVEMSVASTKAFYSQVAAGALLACAIAEAAGVGDPRRRHDVLAGLRELPAALEQVLARRDDVADAARRLAPAKRYWAVVGNGPNRVAAEEVRIKLSELCYKSIACDVTEDKKHIDLSSEPLIVVCAAGLRGSTADDVAKETAIFRAHKATSIVIADEGETRYAASATIHVPAVDPALAFVLSAMVGHLFGYEAALAIDGSARVLREARELIEASVGAGATGEQVLDRLVPAVPPLAAQFDDGLRSGSYDGHLEASTAVRLAAAFGYLTGPHPVEEYQRRTGKVGSPAALVDEVVAALTAGIEELTRPVDAIKHQAKTVTVGISRSDEGVVDRALVQAVFGAGAGRDVVSYRTLKVLAALDPAVEAVTGYTRYRIEGAGADRTIAVVDRGGVSLDIPSRVDGDARLVGTKRRVADEREVLVARGRRDGRLVIFVPETKADQCTGITLLHVRFHEVIDTASMRRVLQGYDRRYDRLVDWVTETEGAFDDELLGRLPVIDLLVNPISETADLWRR